MYVGLLATFSASCAAVLAAAAFSSALDAALFADWVAVSAPSLAALASDAACAASPAFSLAEFAELIKACGDFCVGGACYPEVHPDSADRNADIEGLKRKVEAGCEYLTTQMFFDNNIFFNFIGR